MALHSAQPSHTPATHQSLVGDACYVWDSDFIVLSIDECPCFEGWLLSVGAVPRYWGNKGLRPLYPGSCGGPLAAHDPLLWGA